MKSFGTAVGLKWSALLRRLSASFRLYPKKRIANENAARTVYLQGQRRDGAGTLYPMLLNPLGGNVGIGVTPVARLHVKSVNEIGAFETTAAADGGSGFVSIRHSGGGRMGYWGYGGPDNTMYVMNERSGALYFGTGGTVKWLVQATGNFIPGADNAYNAGHGSQRIAVVFAATGTINTSDEREKTWRETLGVDVVAYAPNLYEAELRAGLRSIEELGFFQWNDSIADPDKGPEGARWHFGPRAQRVWAICAEEGLCDALIPREPDGDWLPPEGCNPPAFLCFDEWEEETAPVLAWWRPSDILGVDGNPEMVPCAEGEEGTEQRPTGETYVRRPAGNRFGVRIDQLHSLMIAALNVERLGQAAMIADLTARVAALEPVA